MVGVRPKSPVTTTRTLSSRPRCSRSPRSADKALSRGRPSISMPVSMPGLLPSACMSQPALCTVTKPAAARGGADADHFAAILRIAVRVGEQGVGGQPRPRVIGAAQPGNHRPHAEAFDGLAAHIGAAGEDMVDGLFMVAHRMAKRADDG